MRLGIIGLPGSGKTTIFNLLTEANLPVGEYLPGTHVNVGTMEIDDERLEALSRVYDPDRTSPATITFGDIAGWESGLSGELANELEGWDGLIHVVRHFDAPVAATPQKDIESVRTELLLHDLAQAEAWRGRLEEELGKGARDRGDIERELKLVADVLECLEEEKPLRDCSLSESDLRGHNLLTLKPLMLLRNMSEGTDLQAEPRIEHSVTLFGKLEMEISQLDEADAAGFRDEFGIGQSGVREFVDATLQLLDHITFFTVSEPEVRAWAIEQGATALEAAGMIHSDMERGFIRAEVIDWGQLVELGGLAQARETGKLRLEGKDYQMRDGEVLYVRFNV